MSAIFGPVNSRRFGTSLGIDLSPGLKQCNFDCLYCELAPAAPVTKQQQHSGVDEIIAELKAALATHPNIDDITVTANGEPTLYPDLDALLERIDAIKGDTKTLILTNSATLGDPKTFATLLKFDRVKLSLDAVTPEVFKKIDRPAKGLEIDRIVDAVKAFSRAYKGELFIEILFVHGLNDSDEEIAGMNAVLRGVACKRIDIGTIDRPPAYPVQGLSYGELYAAAAKFDPDLPVHIASRTHAEACRSAYTEEEILNTLDKRPLTLEDMRLLFDDASMKKLETLVENGAVATETTSGIRFYLPAENLNRKRRKAT
jgi:wyosine [tRNA(Phe)-imidazoG37] synthetase (radical SAM superfamily)